MIAPALFAYRSSPVSGLGVSPAQIEFERKLRMPGEQWNEYTLWDRIKALVEKMPLFQKEVKQKIVKIHQQVKERDKTVSKTFSVRQNVLVKWNWIGQIENPFEEKWQGSYKIIKVYNAGVYVFEDHNGIQIKFINKDCFKKYKDRLF